jgi:lysophospholipase L1-like esterase
LRPMKQGIRLVFASALLLSCTSIAAENAAENKTLLEVAGSSKTERRVVCVGDSNTCGAYPRLLGKALGEGWTAVGCGRGGATVIEGTLRPYHNLPQYKESLASKPDVVIIMLGTNDANPRWWDDPERKTAFIGSPSEEFKVRYLALIQAFQSLATKPQVILVAPLPIFPERSSSENMRAKRIGRRENLVNHVAPIIREIAEEQKLPLVDLQLLMADQQENCKDGVHYTLPGYTVLAEILKVKIMAEQDG